MEDLCVVPRKDLQKRFLDTVQEQAQIAQRENEQLLILIFGYGDLDSSGIVIGRDSEDSAPVLFMRDIDGLLPKDLSATLLMPSCHSGGWLVRPELTGMDQGSETSTTSNMSRISASVAASIIFQTLFTIEDVPEELDDHDLRYSIFEAVRKLHHCGETKQVNFNTLSDDWEANYRCRLGLPLVSYKSRWQSLRETSETTYINKDAEAMPVLSLENVQQL